MTEQGEVILAKFRHERVAMRSLGRTLAAVAGASAGAQRRAVPSRWRTLTAELADVACAHYRALVFEHPGFPAFFAAVTTIDLLGELNLGSRPGARGGQRSVATLRAIPWVFSWTQSRIALPSWYGAGTALRGAPPEMLREMWLDWPFFTALTANIEAALAAVDVPIASAHFALAGEGSEIAALITAEHAACVETLATVIGRTPAGAPNGRRAGWLDALASLQIALIRRLRGGDESAREPLLGTIAGIATGLRVTG